MAESLVIEQPAVLDILDQSSPALSSTNDVPIVETKPDSVQAAPEPEVEEETTEDEGKTEGESATPPDSTSASDTPPKKAQGVQKRLDELVKQREEANDRAKAADERLQQALAALEKVTGKPEEPAKAETQAVEGEPVKPSKYDFPDPDAWDAAILEYADKRALWVAQREVTRIQDEQKRIAQESQIEESQKVVREAYNERISKVQEKYPDFKTVAESPDVQVSIPVAHAIIHSEHGPDLQYYLGKNPDEAARIMKLAPPLQLIEVGRIIGQLNAPTAAAAPKPVSAAPRPISPITKGISEVQKDPDSMSMEEYAAYRKAQNGGKPLRH